MSPTPAPMLFDRQKHLLALLHALGGHVGNMDFQKLLFLYCQEAGSVPVYEFVPYRFGAFSFTSYADRRKLMQHGLLENDETNWTLSPKGRRTAKRLRMATGHAALFSSRNRGLRGDALVADTYRRYPYYATRSEITERVLGSDVAALRRIGEARRAPAISHLSTIGYEGRTLEGFLNELLKYGVTLLCDVRRNAISRKYGFSKGTLSKGCEGVGIRYEHLPELGIASAERQGLETQADYDALFNDYERISLPDQLPTLTKIRDWVLGGDRVALTCYERLMHQCHRHRVADALLKEFGDRFAPRHL